MHLEYWEFLDFFNDSDICNRFFYDEGIVQHNMLFINATLESDYFVFAPDELHFAGEGNIYRKFRNGEWEFFKENLHKYIDPLIHTIEDCSIDEEYKIIVRKLK